MERKLRIGVIGSSSPRSDIYALAEEVGREIASKDAILICGGLGGVMEAACKGAKSGGGTTIGILPGIAATDANPYVDIPIVTGLKDARNVIVVLSSDAIIAVGGRYGTLSEIAYALHFKIPLVGLRTWEISKKGHVEKGIIRAESPKEAVEKALELTEGRK